MIFSLDGRRPKFLGSDYFIADNATVIGSVTLHQNVSVWFGSVLRGDTDDLVIGENTNIQDGAVLHTDPGIKLTIGRNVTVGHQAMLHGCTIGDDCIVGIGAVVLNRAKVGKNSIVGANSLITEGKEFPDGSLIIGSPAKVMRSLSPAEQQSIAANALYYVENFKRFKKGLVPISG